MSQTLENRKNSRIKALVAESGAGDKNAYEALYHEYFPKISRFVGYRINDKETAEDLTAEIFLKIWENLQTPTQIDSFNSWIFTVARNKIIDYYRTKKVTSNLFELENQLEYEDNIINAIDLDIASRKCLRHLDKLSADQQEIIRLKFFEDLENDEIGAITDKSPGTIRVIQHRAIIALKKYLKEEDSPANVQ